VDQADAPPALRVPIYCSRCPVLVWATLDATGVWWCQCCRREVRNIVYPVTLRRMPREP
jgi:ribosomal protein L37AE/L43A